MRNRFLVKLGTLAASALLVGPAFAQTATTQFNVQITITQECRIDTAADMDFGTHGLLDTAPITTTGEISVTCSPQQGYELALNAGQGDGATVANRLMSEANGETVVYSLYQDAAHTQVWGDAAGTAEVVSGVGDGTAQLYDVFGLVPVQPTPPGGPYADVITVTVSY